MAYSDQLEQTSTGVADQVLAALALYVAGEITLDALTGLVAAYIMAGIGAAAALADLSLSSVLTVKSGRVAAPVGIVPDDASDRLQKATRTIARDLDAEISQEAIEAAQKRIERLAEAEVKRAAAEAYLAALREAEAEAKAERHSGWKRGLDADPCQLCRWWHRDGRIWPMDHDMPRHTGCTCVPIPVLNLDRPPKPVVIR